jgi:hypothetical protein
MTFYRLPEIIISKILDHVSNDRTTMESLEIINPSMINNYITQRHKLVKLLFDNKRLLVESEKQDKLIERYGGYLADSDLIQCSMCDTYHTDNFVCPQCDYGYCSECISPTMCKGWHFCGITCKSLYTYPPLT